MEFIHRLTLVWTMLLATCTRRRMKWNAFVCFLSILTVGAHSLAGQPAPAAGSDNLPSLTGKVTNSQTGQPLRKAYVQLRPLTGDDSAMKQTTDAQGQFKFSGIHPGSYRVEAIHNGFVSSEYLPAGSGQPSVLRFDRQSIADLVIPMIPAAVFTGRVVDEDGDPLPKVRVQCLRFFYLQGKRKLMPIDGTSTDDRGQYRIANLEPGRYFLTASYRDSLHPSLSVSDKSETGQGYATVYYPGVIDAEHATDLVVGPGDERDLGEFQLAPMRLVSVTGRVAFPAAGTAPGGLNVSLLPTSGSFMLTARQQTRVATDGNFRINGIAPGSYTIMAQDGATMTARQAIKVGLDGLDNVTLTLSAGIRLAGRVRVEMSSNLKTVSGLRIFLIPQDGVVLPKSGSGVVGANGKFELDNISENSYQLQIDGLPQDFYVKSARLAEQDGAQKPLTIRPGDANAEFELLLSPNGGHVSGIVTDDNHQPFVDATVVLVPEVEKRNMTHLFAVTQTDQSGRFELRGVSPGQYKAFAWSDIEDGAYCDPAVLAPYENKGKTITVEEKGQHTIDLNVLPKA